MIAFTWIGVVVAGIVGLPLTFITLDWAAARIAHALREAMRL